ncbi:hypothetical protein Nepgr_019271 [Nepenthes gracilis]|uniref:mitogen-activated protein kinase kinase kinase n=1 Tax=Nepenthes gracilis TaxID=150966 RepID=A0AAD3XV25_NEPGR|nr:hypothetical protein Nepgr_019271 [Nepenthes gracilis]
MHHLLKIFADRKQRKGMIQTRSPRPKLVRRNAAKNFDYAPTSSASSSSSARSSTGFQTRSLDISQEQASFRIEGNVGELDSVCRSLGISGPDDFEIPKELWEAMKSRSSDVTQQYKLIQLDLEESEEPKKHIMPRLVRSYESEALKKSEVQGVDYDLCDTFEGTFQVGEVLGACKRSCKSAGSRGIRGDRPQLLHTHPPEMSLPVLDNICSTWGPVEELGPEDEVEPSLICHETFHSSDDVKEDERENADQEGINEGSVGETVVLSGSCSFDTSHDDDSSSTTLEPVSIVSPNGRLRGHITAGWEKGELLGQGSFGKVYTAFSSEGFFFAVKEVSLIEHGSQGRESIYMLEQEIELLSRFEHENIVRYLGTDKDKSKLYIFLELVTQGSLASLYQKYQLRDSHVSSYTRQILLGLKYLHDRNVVHRDIKCANILVASDGIVKLADFGLAKATKLNDLKSSKGTAFWMAPEVVHRKNEGYGLPADIWSLGCTVLEMLTSHVPYHPLEFMQALFRIGKGEPPPVPDTLSRDARGFILECLQRSLIVKKKIEEPC